MGEFDVVAIVDYGTLITFLLVLLAFLLKSGSVGSWWVFFRRVEIRRESHPFRYWVFIAAISSLLLLVMAQAVERLFLA